MKRAGTLGTQLVRGLMAGALVLAGCGGGGGGDSECGDGVPRLPEMCDDGNNMDGDGCSATCQVEHGFICFDTPSHCVASCGDGIVAATEECDDGNSLFMDGCGAGCEVEHGFECSGEPSVCRPICGDGSVQTGEGCDDGNTVSGDGCSAICVVEDGYECPGIPSQCHGVCGNGGMTPDEECDDGNTAADDGCSADCVVEAGWSCSGSPSVCTGTCGDGIVVGTEDCDDGDETAACNDDCTVAACGDGKVNASAGEECDTAGESPSCDDDCTTPECGDGVVNGAAAEACDDGNLVAGDGCDGCTVEPGWYCNGEPSSCTTQCGDGTVAGTEACDDGNTVDCDGCAANCTVEPITNCGDGARECGEQCDDGNAVAGDGCDGCVVEAGWSCAGAPSVCTTTCGDGIRVGTEQCDDGNTVDCDGCSASCALEAAPNCGDGNQVCGEQCDDGNNISGDGCSATCVIEYCGDGILQAGLGEVCDEGGDTATCDGDCTPVLCGDGYRNPANGESCDDGNLVSGDGCDAACQSEYVVYVDPVAGGHTINFDGLGGGWDDDHVDVTLPFAFPYWATSSTTNSTSTMGFGTNGALKMGGGYTTYSVIPLWTFSTTGATIHPHGADGYVDTASHMYSYSDATMAVFTWTNMAYCCPSPGNWGVQVVLYPNGNFSIYQITATTDTTRTITIGLSDGNFVNNAVAGATFLDWDAQSIGVPFSVGQVDFGSSEAGGMATGRHLLFEYNPTTGYTCTVTQ